jgi:hypothetical protein
MSYKDKWIEGFTEIIGSNRGSFQHILFLIDYLKDLHPPEKIIQLIKEYVEEQNEQTRIKFKQTIKK